MTEYEVLDLISTHRTEGGFHVMNFAAAMFGYLAAAYFVGTKLSRLQTIAITFLFCLFVPGPMAAAHDAALSITYLTNTYGTQFESVLESAKTLGTIAPTVVPATIVAGWIVSMLFMWQIRRSR
jgi:hypothetical protein